MNHLLRSHEIVKTDFVRGENCYLYDVHGQRYVDFESGIWCTVLGHTHPHLNGVMRAQLEQLMHLGTRYPSPLAEEAAVAVLEMVGMGEGKGTFLSSGSEAVEFGVQVARRVTGRPRLLTLSRSYLAAYGSAGRRPSEEWGTVDADICAGEGLAAYLGEIPFSEIGAFVFEPGGSGSAYVRFPDRALVQELAWRVREAGGLLVANEVTTGMGRTGRWFGFQHYELRPDIVALGKGLGNGYPVSAVALTGEVAKQVEAGGLRYAQSHQNDPLGCAVARAVIHLLREERWIERGREIGTFFLAGLKRLEEEHAAVKEARGRGMLLGLELHPEAHRSVTEVYRALLKAGFLVGYYPAGHFLRFSPALTIEEEEVVRLLRTLSEILGGDV